MPTVRAGEECYLTLRYITAHATAWAPKGFEVGHDQLRLASKPAIQRAPRAATTTAVQVLGANLRAVRVGRTTISFDDMLGVDLRHDDQPLLARGPELAVWRAPIDNNGLKLVTNPWKTLARWETLGVDALHLRDEHVDLRQRRGVVEVRRAARYWGGDASDDVIDWRERITIAEDGAIAFAEEVRLPDRFADLPRLGMRFDLVPGFEEVEWYGRGPHECYPDRDRGAALGRHASTVTDQYVPYVMPQEHGLHTATHWCRLSNGALTVRVKAADPFLFSALHHAPEDLTAAKHDVELRARAETIVHVDHLHRGLGTASCGPDTLPQYRISAGRHRWTWHLRVDPT
jgi:beta-galactosidase